MIRTLEYLHESAPWKPFDPEHAVFADKARANRARLQKLRLSDEEFKKEELKFKKEYYAQKIQ